MTDEQKKWYDRGYTEQCWGYPLLDHAWGSSEPKKFQEVYREGQIKAWKDGEASKPWFI